MLLDYLYDYEMLVRLASFVLVFAAFAIWELLAPRRVQQYPKVVRWINNLSITLLNTLITRLAIPLAAVTMAAIAQQQNLGLLNQVNLPVWLLIIIAVVIMYLFYGDCTACTTQTWILSLLPGSGFILLKLYCQQL